MTPIPIVIVTFGNPDEVAECLESLAGSNPEPAFDVYICENGGSDAYSALCAALTLERSPCVPAQSSPACATSSFLEVRCFSLRGRASRVFVGNPGENLGYGGGVNRWLRPLLADEDWPGALVLNPDTTVDPNALAAVVDYASLRGKGMVTGRIVMGENRARILTRGIRWRPFLASSKAIGRNDPADSPVAIERLEKEIDAPSGAFVYVTRSFLLEIGLMEEAYFLYFEDVEWGLRAKRSNNIGYAFDALVYHMGSTSIGAGRTQPTSELSTYLSFRNRLLFVRAERPAWMPWTVIITAVRAVELAVRGNPGFVPTAFRGMRDGLAGLTGRPDAIIDRHLAMRERSAPTRDVPHVA